MIWPFRRTRRPDPEADERLSDLDDRLDAAHAVVDAHEPRVRATASRAESALARRAKAIEENHLDRLFIIDLRGHP